MKYLEVKENQNTISRKYYREFIILKEGKAFQILMENYFNEIILKKMISFLLFPFRELYVSLWSPPRWKFHYFHKYKFIWRTCYLEFQEPENVRRRVELNKQNKTSKKNHQCNYLVLASFLFQPTPICNRAFSRPKVNKKGIPSLVLVPSFSLFKNKWLEIKERVSPMGVHLSSSLVSFIVAQDVPTIRDKIVIYIWHIAQR